MSPKKNSECTRFGKSLRGVRLKLGFSQEELAEKAHVHRTYLGGLERGERNPTLTVMVRVAQALKLPLSKLIEGMDCK